MDRKSRKGLVLWQARQQLGSEGAEGLRMSELAHACEMSARTLYLLFPSREALLEAVYLKALEELEASIERALFESSEPREAHQNMWRALADIFEHERLGSVLLELERIRHRFGDYAARSSGATSPALLRFLDDARVRGVVKDARVEELAGMVWALFTSAVGRGADRRALALAERCCWDALCAPRGRVLSERLRARPH
ncbi:MAG: TetR/AcrR family transcriptional regulator [Myxococcota bacterium]